MKLVDLSLVGHDLRSQPQIAMAHGVDGANDLTLNQPAHRGEGAAHGIDISIELLEGMVGHERLAMEWGLRAISRNGR